MTYGALRFKRGKKHARRFLREWHGSTSNASVGTLERRMYYGGRKGRRAEARLRLMGIDTPRGYIGLPFQFSDVTFTIGGKKFEGMKSVTYGGFSK